MDNEINIRHVENGENWRYHVRHAFFLDLAVNQFLNAEDAYVELMGLTNQEPDDATYELVDAICNQCIETVCFTVMALESYINTFSAAFISEVFAESIDRLDVPAKWTVAMKMYSGIDLLKGQAPLQGIYKCTRIRNSFMHSKSKPLNKNGDGCISIPQLDLYKDYMLPAYEALTTVAEISDWIEKNCPSVTVNICYGMREYLTCKFKETKKTWYFNEPTVMF